MRFELAVGGCLNVFSVQILQRYHIFCLPESFPDMTGGWRFEYDQTHWNLVQSVKVRQELLEFEKGAFILIVQLLPLHSNIGLLVWSGATFGAIVKSDARVSGRSLFSWSLISCEFGHKNETAENRQLGSCF
jgi:hypothetical protein